MVDYISIQHNDPDNASEVTALSGHDNLADYRRGLDVTSAYWDGANSNFSISGGECWIMVDEYRAITVDEPRYNCLLCVHLDRRREIPVKGAGVNHVFVVADALPPGEATRNNPDIEVNLDGNPPSDDSLKIAEINTRNETYRGMNNAPAGLFDVLETGLLRINSATVWPDGNRTVTSPITWDSRLDHVNVRYDDALNSDEQNTKRYVRKSRYADSSNYANESGHSDDADELVYNNQNWTVDEIVDASVVESSGGWTFLDYFEHGDPDRDLEWTYRRGGSEGGDGEPYDIIEAQIYMENRLISEGRRPDDYPSGTPRNNLIKCIINDQRSNDYYWRVVDSAWAHTRADDEVFGGITENGPNDDWKLIKLAPQSFGMFTVRFACPQPVINDPDHHYPTFSVDSKAKATNDNGFISHGYLEQSVESLDSIFIREPEAVTGWCVMRGWRKDDYLELARN